MTYSTSDDKILILSEKTYALLDSYHRIAADILKERGLVRIVQEDENN